MHFEAFTFQGNTWGEIGAETGGTTCGVGFDQVEAGGEI